MALKAGLFMGAATVMTLGCGGSGSSDPTAQLQTGVFIDSPVAGIEYRTESQSGVTDDFGRFQFLPGELVSFAVGAVELGTAPASETVYISELDGLGNPFDTAVLNKVQFLLALDSDQNGHNGIQLETSVLEAATAWPRLDFEHIDYLSDALLALSSDIRELLSQDFEWVSEGASYTHMEQTLACANAGIYSAADPVDDNQTLYLTVHSNGVLQALSQSQSQSLWTNLQFSTVGGSYDSEVRPLIWVEDRTPDMSNFLVTLDPRHLFSQHDYPIPIFDHAFIPAPLLAQVLDTIPVPTDMDVLPEPEVYIDGTIATQGQIDLTWRSAQNEWNITGLRLVDKSPDDIKVLASYRFVADHSGVWQQGLVELVVNSDGQARGVLLDTELQQTSNLQIVVDQDPAAGEWQLSLSGESGFEAVLVLDINGYSAHWQMTADEPELTTGYQLLLDSATVVDDLAQGVYLSDDILVCR